MLDHVVRGQKRSWIDGQAKGYDENKCGYPKAGNVT
jgi:hypothetical protein